jgi:preprotein translocase subunit YajC
MSDVFFTLAQTTPSGTSGTGVGIPGASAAPIPAASAAPEGATTGTGTTQTATTGTAVPGPGPAPSIWSSPLIPMLGVMAVFMLLMWWQGRKQSKQREALLNSVKKHDKVATTAGIIGTVVELNDQEMVLAVENGKIRFNRSALATVLKSEGKSDPKSDAKIEAKPLATASV